MTSSRFCRTLSLIVALSLLGLAMGAEEHASNKTYKIKLERPSKVGEKADVSVTATMTETATFSFKDREPEKSVTSTAITLEGHGETLAIDSHGWETKASLKLTKTEINRDGKTTTILPAGTLLEVSLDGDKTVFKVDGKPVSDEAADALSEVLFLHDARTHGDDEVYVNDKPQKVGANWPLNADLAAKDLSVLGLPVTSKHVTGSSSLVDVETSDGVPCLHVQLIMDADEITAQMAEGLVPGKTAMQMLLHIMVPIDQSSQYGRASLATRVAITATRPAGKDGPAATIRRVIERGRSVIAKPVK